VKGGQSTTGTRGMEAINCSMIHLISLQDQIDGKVGESKGADDRIYASVDKSQQHNDHVVDNCGHDSVCIELGSWR